ncbi:MAG: hypothetical protein IJ673_13065 [Treponema sp.]|nr:hypothetical protein [Treponema sp.]
MKFIKATAILAGLVMAGAFSSCSNLDESNSGTISLTLPGSSERAATSSATAKENFLDSLVYEVYLTKDTTKSLDTDSTVDNFFQAVVAFFESLGSIQKQTGKAGDTISFRDIDEGDYNVYLCYKSDDYKAFGYDTKTISVKNGMQSRVKFEFDYPDSVKFAGYTAIADGTGLKDAVAKLSTNGVEYPDEDTYTKFYLTSDITIGGNTPISISSPETYSYGIVLDLNGHTISLDDGDNALSVETNVNIIIRNGTIAPGVTQFLNLDADATVELDGITVKTGDSEDEENTTFLSVNSGTVVATGGSSLTNVSVNGGIFIMLGGSVKNVSQSNGSLALVEEWTATNGVTNTKKTFTATGANRITTYTLEGENWLLVYFGGDSKIVNDVDASSTLQYFRLMQTSECKTDCFITLANLDQNSANAVTEPILLTENPQAQFSLVAPVKSNFILKGSEGSEDKMKWYESVSEATATSDGSNYIYKGYRVNYE